MVMDRRSVFSSILAASALAVAACDRGGGNPSGSDTSSSVSSGTGGSTTTPSAWKQGDPGKPGAKKLLGEGFTFGQGLAKSVTPTQGVTTKSAEMCGGPGTTTGAGGGAGGANPSMETCPTTFVDPNPSFQTEEVTPLVIASMPALRPAGCSGEYEPLSFGTVYVGDCNGVTAFQPFTAEDVTTFFRGGEDLFPATTLPINGSEVTLISGVAVKTAMVADTIYAVSNVSSKLIQYDTTQPDPLLARSEINLETKGISGLQPLNDGTLVFATIRSFTQESWNKTNEDPSTLVEAEPIHIRRFDPTTQMVTDVATISNGSRVTGQNSVQAGVDGNGDPTMYIAGTTNMMTLAQDGSLLFSDRLAGKVYKIALDGTVTPLFTLPEGVLISGLTQPPNGVIYVVKAATSDENGNSMISPPVIAYWDDLAQELVDWQVLPDAISAETLHVLASTGVIERNISLHKMYVGSGLHTEMAYDDLGNLVVSTTLTGTAESIHVDIVTP